MNLKRIRVVSLGAAGLALAIAVGAVVRGAQEGEQRTRSRSEFMRMKLEYSKKVLEGLTLEDYAGISKNAKALKRLSEAAEWEVPTIPNAGDYIVFTSEFQRLADEMDRKAKDKNIDGATLAYLRLTMNCVNCHKYVRQVAK
jgi:cytochrome c556